MRLKCGKINSSLEYEKPKDFLQSQWQTSEKSVAYVAFRWALAIFYFFSVAVSIFHSTIRQHLHVYLIYLTHWNLCVSMTLMVFHAAIVTAFHFDRLKIEKRMTKSMKLFWILSTSSTMYAFVVSIIYWTVLYKTELNAVDLNNVLVHLTNSLLLLVNICVVKQPERFGLFVYNFVFGVVFAFFTWLYPFLGGKNR